MAGILRSLILCDRGEKDDVVIADDFLDDSEAEKNCQRKHLDQKKGDVMKKGLRLLFIIAAMVTFSMATSGWAANLIDNGDFELGVLGTFTTTDLEDATTTFTSPPESGGIWPEGYYTIKRNLVSPDLYHPNADSTVDDHTKKDGTGYMMAINGPTSQGVDVVWAQQVIIPEEDRGKNFIFSVWGTNWVKAEETDPPGLLEVWINDPDREGDPASPTVFSPTQTGVWEELFFEWESGNARTAFIEIVSGSFFDIGNDYALDDISFQVVPIPQTVWLFGTALLFLIGLKRKSSS